MKFTHKSGFEEMSLKVLIDVEVKFFSAKINLGSFRCKNSQHFFQFDE